MNLTPGAASPELNLSGSETDRSPLPGAEVKKEVIQVGQEVPQPLRYGKRYCA